MITLHNTLTKTKERLVPRHDKKIQMFVCGPTVYDYIHIGNARTFVFFDVVAKYLRSQGYEVDYIQNITDIDDKIINRASQEGKNWKEVADFYFEEFKKDTSALGISDVRYIKATDKVEEVKRQVKVLKSRGNVYLIENDGWYFDLKTFPEYGKLSGRNVEMSDDAVSRIDESDKKRNRGDFCVWKLAKNGENWWDDEELGNGRPGWHIEDTAITESQFGSQYDIHGGGQDLIFPHHEAEIAQQESASGKKSFLSYLVRLIFFHEKSRFYPLAKYWMHVGFLVNEEQKMSKSLRNIDTIKYRKEILRFYLLSGYYRQPLEFSGQILEQSQKEVDRIYLFLNALNSAKDFGDEDAENQIIKSQKQFFEAMDNDFNTPQAFAFLFELIRNLNQKLLSKSINKKSVEKAKEFVNKIDSILKIIPTEQIVPPEIQESMEKMDRYREEKKYDEADKIRTELEGKGFIIHNVSQAHSSTVIAGIKIEKYEKPTK